METICRGPMKHIQKARLFYCRHEWNTTFNPEIECNFSRTCWTRFIILNVLIMLSNLVLHILI